MNDGQLIVVSGPSGCGKDTIISKVLQIMGDDAFLSVSMTTRSKRAGEQEGVSYYFVSVDEFENNIRNGKMLEYAKYGHNYYGTPAEPIERLVANGKTVFLNIEVQGGSNVKRLMPQAVKIFVLPPSLKELKRRLIKRGTETEQAIAGRMKIALSELEKAEEYDYIIINDSLDSAVDDMMSIIRAEKLKEKNMKNIVKEVIKNV